MLPVFIAAKRVEGCSEKSLRYYESTIRNMLECIGKPECQIITEDLRSYLDTYQRRGTVSKVTLDNVRRILSSFFAWLEDEDYIVKSPVRRIHKVKTGKTVKETYSDESLELMRDHCDNARDLAMIDLLASTGIIICGDCGEMFRRIHWNNRGCKSIVWRCISKLEPTGLECHARTINELDLQEIVLTALNELLGDKSKYQKQLQQNITSVIRASAAITTDGIDEKLIELQQELVKKANNKEAYDEIADQIFALREKRQQASMDTVQRDEQLQRITELQDFIKDQSSDLTVFDEALVKRWLKQIVIWPTHCTVELKSGLKVDVERKA